MENQKKKFNFKEYYNTHPEFRQRHLDKCMEKIRCTECGRCYNRCYKAKHLRTKIHDKFKKLAQDAEIDYAESDSDSD